MLLRVPAAVVMVMSTFRRTTGFLVCWLQAIMLFASTLFSIGPVPVTMVPEAAASFFFLPMVRKGACGLWVGGAKVWWRGSMSAAAAYLIVGFFFFFLDTTISVTEKQSEVLVTQLIYTAGLSWGRTGPDLGWSRHWFCPCFSAVSLLPCVCPLVSSCHRQATLLHHVTPQTLVIIYSWGWSSCSLDGYSFCCLPFFLSCGDNSIRLREDAQRYPSSLFIY